MKSFFKADLCFIVVWNDCSRGDVFRLIDQVMDGAVDEIIVKIHDTRTKNSKNIN